MSETKNASKVGAVSEKRANGRYFTLGDPFAGHPAVERLLALLPETPRVVEPCAGMGHLARSFLRAVPGAEVDMFDLVPRRADETECGLPVRRRDSLARFPKGYDVVVMNPPYLSKVSARRLGVPFPETELEDLYEVALEGALRESPYVLAVLPGSFATSRRFRDRLVAVIAMSQGLFGDTEHPSCVALFGPDETDDHEVYVGERLVGTARALAALEPSPARSLGVRFNIPTGEISFRGVDAKKGGIGFYAGDFVAPSEVRSSSKFATRIELPQGFALPVERVIERANRLVAEYRERTSDMGLCAFRDERRRMSFGQARAFLSLAVEELEREAEAVAREDRASENAESVDFAGSPKATIPGKTRGLDDFSDAFVGLAPSGASGSGDSVRTPASLVRLHARVADDRPVLRLMDGSGGRSPWGGLDGNDGSAQLSGDLEVGFNDCFGSFHAPSPFSWVAASMAGVSP